MSSRPSRHDPFAKNPSALGSEVSVTVNVSLISSTTSMHATATFKEDSGLEGLYCSGGARVASLG
jgi:hypothetical protein